MQAEHCLLFAARHPSHSADLAANLIKVDGRSIIDYRPVDDFDPVGVVVPCVRLSRIPRSSCVVWISWLYQVPRTSVDVEGDVRVVGRASRRYASQWASAIRMLAKRMLFCVSWRAQSSGTRCNCFRRYPTSCCSRKFSTDALQ
jgi:hypothetical protein